MAINQFIPVAEAILAFLNHDRVMRVSSESARTIYHNSSLSINENLHKPDMIVKVDQATVAQEQKSVDAGHSPWKLDPVFVAQVFASLLLSPQGIIGDYPISYEDIHIIANDETNAIAMIRDDKSIAKYIYLKRLIRQEDTGIWTVVGYDIK